MSNTMTLTSTEQVPSASIGLRPLTLVPSLQSSSKPDKSSALFPSKPLKPLHLRSTPIKPKHVDMNGDEFELPNFKMQDVFRAIPRHCFKKSTSTTLFYVFRDIFYLLAASTITAVFVPFISSSFIRFLAYTAHTILAGIILTGLWALGHEAGHNALTPSRALNNTLGFILHSSVLTPYFSFQATHAKHHQSTSDLQQDTVYVPQSRAQWVNFFFGSDANPTSIVFKELAEDAPLVSLWHCVIHQLLGWWGYMLDNATANEEKHGFPHASHFWFFPSSMLFKDDQLMGVFLSDLGVVAMLYILYHGIRFFGWGNFMIFYFLPYLWVNHWVVAITYVQHTDGSLPHYDHSTWTFARGAAATIDRPAGFLDTYFWHNITSTHVCHHLCSSIPFYHAPEATLHIKKVLGKHYHSSPDTSILSAFWDAQKNCQFVEESSGMDGSGVYFFRNLHGKGTKPRDLSRGERQSGVGVKRGEGVGEKTWAMRLLRGLFFDKVLTYRNP